MSIVHGSSLSLVPGSLQHRLSQENIACKQQLHILRKPSHKRTNADLRRLGDGFDAVQFFKDLDQVVKIQVCKALKLEHFPHGHIVFRENEAGDKFYIVLHGSVSVCIKDVSAEDVERREAEEQERKSIIKKSLSFADEEPKIIESANTSAFASEGSCGDKTAENETSAVQNLQPQRRQSAEAYSSNHSLNDRQGSKSSSALGGTGEMKKASIHPAVPTSTSETHTRTEGTTAEKLQHFENPILNSSAPPSRQASRPGSLANSRQGSKNSTIADKKKVSMRLVEGYPSSGENSEGVTTTHSERQGEDVASRNKAFSIHSIAPALKQMKPSMRRTNTTALEASQPRSLRDMMKNPVGATYLSDHVGEYDSEHPTIWPSEPHHIKTVNKPTGGIFEHAFAEFGTQEWLQSHESKQPKEARRASQKSPRTQVSPNAPDDGPKTASALNAGDDPRKSIKEQRRMSMRYTSVKTEDVSNSARDALFNVKGCLQEKRSSTEDMSIVDWLQSKEVEQEFIPSGRRQSVPASILQEAALSKHDIGPMLNRRKSATKPMARSKTDILPRRRGSHFIRISKDIAEEEDDDDDSSGVLSSFSDNFTAKTDSREESPPESPKLEVAPVASPPTSSEDDSDDHEAERHTASSRVSGDSGSKTRLKRARGTACGRLLKHSIAKLAQASTDDKRSSSSSSSHRSQKSCASKKSSNAPDSEKSSGLSDSDSEAYSSFSSFAQSQRMSRMTSGSRGSHRSGRQCESEESGTRRVSTVSTKSTKSVTISEPVDRRSVTSTMSAKFRLQRASRKISELHRLIPRLQQVATLRAGAAFGEVALQNDQPRSATIECKEECYFAVLTRDDYKDILKTTFDKQRQDLIDFMRLLPLFAGVTQTSINKITVMLTQRVMSRNELVFDLENPVLQVYFAREGKFSVSAPRGRAIGDDDEQSTAKYRSLGKKPVDPYLSLKKNKHVTLALLEAPVSFGLSCYIRGDRKHQIRVTCKSVNGVVYAVLAKELIHHLTRSCRERLQKSAQLERLFYDNRMLVLQKVASPMETLGGSQGQRRWREDDNLIQKLQVARGDHDSSMYLYSMQGRLRAIAKVFQQSETKVVEAVSDQNGTKEKLKADLSACWGMQTVMSNHPEAVGERLNTLLRKLDKDFNTEESLMYQKSFVALVGVKREEAQFAHASHDDARLALAWERQIFHGEQPDRQPRGRADGSTPTVRPASVNLNVLERPAAQISRRADRTPSTSPGPSRCSRRHSKKHSVSVDERIAAASHSDNEFPQEAQYSLSPQDASSKDKKKPTPRAASSDQKVTIGIDIVQRRPNNQHTVETQERCSTAPARTQNLWLFSDPSIIPEKSPGKQLQEERFISSPDQLLHHDSPHVLSVNSAQDTNGHPKRRFPELQPISIPTPTPRKPICEKTSPARPEKVSPTMPRLASAPPVSPEGIPAGFISECVSMEGSRKLEDAFNQEYSETELGQSISDIFLPEQMIAATSKANMLECRKWLSKCDGLNAVVGNEKKNFAEVKLASIYNNRVEKTRNEKKNFAEVKLASIYNNRVEKTMPTLPSCFKAPPPLIPPKGRSCLPLAAGQKNVATQKHGKPVGTCCRKNTWHVDS